MKDNAIIVFLKVPSSNVTEKLCSTSASSTVTTILFHSCNDAEINMLFYFVGEILERVLTV